MTYIYIKGKITEVTAEGAAEIMRLRALLVKRNKKIRELKDQYEWVSLI